MSWTSRAESLAAQAAEAQIEAAVASAALHVAKAERQQKEELAAAVAKAQARLEFLQCEREAVERAARAAALQAEAEGAAPSYISGKSETESSYSHVEAYVEDQNALRHEHEEAAQSTAKPSGHGRDSQPLVLQPSQKAAIVRSGPRGLPSGFREITPTNQVTRGNQTSPLATAKATQEDGTQETAISELNAKAREFLPGLQDNSNTDVWPNERGQPVWQRGEQPLTVSWKDALIRKYSPENYRLSLAHTTAPGNYAYEDPREVPNHAPTEPIRYTVPPHPNYNSYATPMDPPTSRRGRLDLASSGVQKFSDMPGREYLLWKHMFTNTIQDEGLRPAEEIRHMIAWLGPESAEVVKDIYSSQLGNPVTALRRAWNMLDRQYGASTLTESSLLDRINDFPDISLSESRKLWKFSAILTQLRTAQEDPTLPGLICLDQFRTHLSSKTTTAAM